MTLNEVRLFYKQIVDKEQGTVKHLKKVIFQVGSLRLAVVLGCMSLVYIFWGQLFTSGVIIAISCIVFAILLRQHNKLFKRKQYAEIQVENSSNELNAIDYDFSAFDGAAEKIDQEHNFSFDLDLFGNRSFFQSINRSVTKLGKDCLAQTLSKPLQDKSIIYAHQDAIKELSQKAHFMAHFRTIGRMSEIQNIEMKDLVSMSSQQNSFFRNSFWNFMLYFAPASYIIVALLSVLNIIAETAFIPLWISMIIISSIPTKKVLAVSNRFDKKTSQLETYLQLFQLIEEEKFESQLLLDNQKKIKDTIKASGAIKTLKTYQSNLSMAFAFPTLFFFNPILLWNVKYAAKIEEWLQVHQTNMDRWFNALGEFDSFISLSIFAFNHPDYSYPTIADSFKFEAKSLGHPLLNREVCVRNDVEISQTPYFLVVTGANMAGKSTYLRTIGINHVLACVGAPVCAESLNFYPNKLVTNLRTTDSLADNESYFFAELKRLKMIIDQLHANNNLFIILDEILKGTNSEDKQKGSIALMKQLVALKGNGIIATHDLLLGNLENEYPANIKNYRFEADIENDQLTFSYKIREGIAKNMNACFLMRKMGITGI